MTQIQVVKDALTGGASEKVKETFIKRITDFVIEKPDIALIYAWIIVMPIAILIKIKLDKMTSNNRNYPSIAKYQMQFKKYKHTQNEIVKPNKTSF